MKLPTIGVMILNRNGRDWLEPLFESLQAQAYPNLIVYLVDNASTDDSVSLTLAGYPEVRVIRFSQNVGYCMAYNKAMPIAFADGCQWVVWANNDILLEPGCILELAKVSRQSPDIGVIGPAYYAWDGPEPNYYIKGKHPNAISAMKLGLADPIAVDWVEGSFLMVSAACVRDVGPLDPFLFFYWEETDFCRRARRKGWRVVLAARSLARHYAGGWSSENAENASTANDLKSRNQYIYVLCDPEHFFLVNVGKAAYLFLVLLKSALKKSPASVKFELKVMRKVLCELGDIRKKWRRDRGGIFPPDLSPDYENAEFEVLPSASTSVPAKV